MALKIRLQRGGSKHRPVYRLVVAENTARRDGRFVEQLGTYAPQAVGKDPEYRIKLDRFDYWAGVGAKPTDTVRNLIKRARKEQPEGAEGIAIAPAAVAAVPAEA